MYSRDLPPRPALHMPFPPSCCRAAGREQRWPAPGGRGCAILPKPRPAAISTQDSFGPSKLCPQHIAPRRRDWAGRSEAEPARRASRTINYTRYRRGERASLPLAVQLLVVGVLARPRPAVSPSSSASPARCSACDGRPPTRRAATGLQPCPCSGLGSEAALRPRPARTPHPPAQSAVQTDRQHHTSLTLPATFFPLPPTATFRPPHRPHPLCHLVGAACRSPEPTRRILRRQLCYSSRP